MIYATMEEALAAMRQPDNTSELQPVQIAQYEAYEIIVEEYGQYDKGIGAYGAHYAEENPFVNEGLICSNCVFYANNACEIVAGNIAPNAICKFWIIPESKLQSNESNLETVKKIQELLMSGMTNQEIMSEMPGITVEDIVSAAAEAARSN